jgi:hypothetical protein
MLLGFAINQSDTLATGSIGLDSPQFGSESLAPLFSTPPIYHKVLNTYISLDMAKYQLYGRTSDQLDLIDYWDGIYDSYLLFLVIWVQHPDGDKYYLTSNVNSVGHLVLSIYLFFPH